VPFHRLLKHCIEKRRGAEPGLGARRLKKVEIHDSRSHDLGDDSRAVADLQTIRELVDELYVGDSALQGTER